VEISGPASVRQDIRDASRRDYARLLAAYPGGADGLDLQPFFDLVTIHELGHAFEVLGDLRLPDFWLGEVFADLALHAFVATRQQESLNTLEAVSSGRRAAGASLPGGAPKVTAR
jgi:hypothetical protein